jgi:hypothetical protein
MAKKARRVPVPRRLTLAQFIGMRRDMRRQLLAIRAIVVGNAEVLESLRKECEANLRRCAELQFEIDALKKTSAVHVSKSA